MVIDWNNYDLKKARALARKFGEATVTEMMMNIQNLDLIDRGVLINSIKAGVRTKYGFVDRVQFTYEFYGKFFEYGAENAFGKGVDLPALHWRNEAISKNMDSLNEDFAEFYASLIADEIDINNVKMEM